VIDHVVVRQDVAIRGDNDAGANTLLARHFHLALTATAATAKEAAEEIGIVATAERCRISFAGDEDFHDARADALDHWRKAQAAVKADPASGAQVDAELLALKIDELSAAGPAE